MKKSYKVVVAIAAASLTATMAVTPAANAATKQKVCVALDTGGINDKSFNQLSYLGATTSVKKGYASSAEYLPAASPADYGPNLKKFVDKKCTYIIGVVKFLRPASSTIAYLTVGFASAEAMIASPNAKPTPIMYVHFLSTNFFKFGP